VSTRHRDDTILLVRRRLLSLLTARCGREEKTVLNPGAGARAEGAEFDLFGLFNMQDKNGKDCVIYLDELSYTAGDR
jgi:hypothetical protein